jgi:uncharacterized protein YndB with AHSA1/START domain
MAHDDEVIRREVVLGAPREKVWETLADDEGLAHFLGEDCEFDVEESEPERRLVVRAWTPEDGATIIDLTLDDHEDGTRLVVVELPARALEAIGIELDRRLEQFSGPMLVAA